MSVPLAGSLPVIPTPFYEGRIDYESLDRLLAFLQPHLEGYTIGGSTGESVSLTQEERIELTRYVCRNTPADRAVVVGITHTQLDEMVRLGQAAQEAGARAVLAPCPYYFPNNFEMVRQFFAALDRRLEIDIVFYDNPLYTKTPLRVEDLARLIADCPHLAGVKMTDNNIDKIPPLIRETGTAVFVGDDVVAFRSLLLGCAGSMIIAPSVFPAAYQEVCRLLAAGQTREAFRHFSRSVLPFIHLFGLGDEIVNTKALFHHLGLFRSPETRLPLVPPTEERVREVIMAYEECRGA